MTVSSKGYNWQKHPQPWAAPYVKASPNLVALLSYLKGRWGGSNAGIYMVRPVRGGKSPSTHGAGAALDYSYRDRKELLAVILPFLIGNSAELGVSVIHDYVGGRIWHAGRTKSSSDAFTKWWKPYDGTDFGRPTATWIHIETTPDRWADSTPIEQRISGAPAPGPTPTPAKPSPTKPAPGPTNWTDRIVQNLPTVKSGKSSHAATVQGLLVARGKNIKVDGVIGSGSVAAIKEFQAARGLTADGIVGPKTWQALLTPVP